MCRRPHPSRIRYPLRGPASATGIESGGRERIDTHCGVPRPRRVSNLGDASVSIPIAGSLVRDGYRIREGGREIVSLSSLES